MARMVRPRAFTLIELLVVLSIIAVLFGMLMPALGEARRSAAATRCLAQMRTLAQFAGFYADDYDDHMPRSMHSSYAHRTQPWGYAFSEYARGVPYSSDDASWRALLHGLYRCPLDLSNQTWSYGFNVYYELSVSETGARTWRLRASIPRPTDTVVFCELNESTTADHAMAHYWVRYDAPPEIDTRRHGTTTGVAYLDGHAASVPFETVFAVDRGIDAFNPGTAR